MKELNEAEVWLESAKTAFDSKTPEREKYTVVVAQAIHSIIRANDALTLRFLGKQAMRHDEPRICLSTLFDSTKSPQNLPILEI